MATTQNTYTGNGSTTNYSFTFPYIKAADVKATLNGVTTTAFTLANATTVAFTSAPASGASIIIYRDTDNDTRSATFFAGSAIKAEDLNSNFDQISYVSQETDNNSLNTLGGTMSGDINMASTYKVTNLAAPTAATDSSTKGYVDGLITTHQAQVTAAANSASAAATSASNAATSASNSATSATTSTTQATNSANSATAAATSATNAANSATTATTQANSATTQATNAAASATTAATQASTATTQATAAATSATNSANSATDSATIATSAATSAASALAAFDNFDDTYLGSKSSDPSADNDGDALNGGDLYYNTTSNVMKVYNGSAWVTAYVPGDAANIANTASGNLSSTNVQASLQELQGDIDTLNTAAMPKAGGTFTGDVHLDNQEELRFEEATANGNNFVAFKAPSTIASDVVWTLPATDATVNGHALKSDGSGNLSWGTAGGASGGSTDQVFYENDQTVTTNYSITANKNAMTAGPITVNSGVTVTIPANSNWTIV